MTYNGNVVYLLGSKLKLTGNDGDKIEGRLIGIWPPDRFVVRVNRSEKPLPPEAFSVKYMIKISDEGLEIERRSYV